MATKELEASVRQLGAVSVIDLRGEIDSFGEESLTRAYTEAERQNPTAVLLNFAGVDYINSTGIALIVGLLAQARSHGVHITACGLSDHYREIFEITRLADFMTIAANEDSAVTGTERSDDA